MVLDYLNANRIFRFLIFQVSEAVSTRCTTRLLSNQYSGIFLEYFWKIPELYPEVNLQFMPSVEIKWEIPFSSSVLHK